ncbi:non-ribosomal peptide synthetase [Saccharothrix longispora]|uniref:Amino acid adenylation domain-containing protein n=1 Tax=Saccharothrix longispora TaxID=33920 RepID=A0ABU1PQI9_9PSEU|nr:non-ribosomal peptide synthetase [Saccharothrix longispora]MDR6592731.1 amino acid adenylation domain-containing protein [Saccharothrix longispora]
MSLDIHLLVARQAAATPEAIAVVDGPRSHSYADLESRAERQAAALRAAGVGPGSVVGVCLPRGVDLVAGLLAVWKAGGAYLPLDPDHPGQRNALVLRNAGVRQLLAAPGATAPDVPDLVVLSPHDLPEAAGAPAVDSNGDGAAYVVHTSGSTGTPKGVVVTHAGIANRVDWAVRGQRLTAADRVLQKTAMTFDAAGWEIFAPLTCGGTVVLAPHGAERDPAALVAAVVRHDVTVLQVVPSVLRALVAEDGWDGAGALRLLTCAGEPLHAELVQRFLGLLPAPERVEVWNTYGPTECSIDVTAFRFDPAQRSGPVPIGRPIPGMRVLIADDRRDPVDIGVTGELYAGGVGVARGYLNLPGRTAEAFVPDPHGPAGARLYRTGDLARWREDGYLEYRGRVDQQVKVNGVRIEPGEVEAALAAHPGVRAVAVVPFATPDGGTRLVAYHEATGQAEVGDLRAYLAERLPATHVPSAFVGLDRLPLLASGKVDRSALPEPAAGEEKVAPRTAAERLVERVWCDLLGVDEVGVHDDFFRLGGSSLQFTRLANRLRKATGTAIDLPKLLSATTLAEQAALVVPVEEVDEAALRRIPRTGPLPVSTGQRRLWLLDRMQPRAREWVSPLFLRVPGDTPDELVRAALDGLLARHESLRTRFTTDRGEPVQVVDPPTTADLRVLGTTADGLATVLDGELDRGIDIERGPLVRSVLTANDAAGDRVLVVLMHHIVCDGWSSAVLERDFTELLAAARAGRAPDLPDLPVQYADYAVWQRERAEGPAVEEELRHWRTVLDGASPLVLHTDKARPEVRDGRGSMVPFTVSALVAEALDELGRELGATSFMTLLSGFTTLLARYTGQWDVVIGTPVSGRDRAEVEDVVGFFLNSVVLRCRLDGRSSFRDTLAGVRDTCRDALAHQGLPFELLVADLAPERDLSRTPLYQVAFDLHDGRLTGSAADPDDLGTLLDLSRTARTDLTLYLRREPDGRYVGGFEYATSLFERATVERMAEHFVRLLTSAAADPGARLAEMDFDGARRPARRPANRVAASFGSVPRLVERQVRAAPDAVALVAGADTATFAELDARANRIAHHLRRRGAGPDAVVAVALDRGIDLMASLLGVWKAGAAYLPVDPNLPQERIGFMLTDADVPVVLTSSAHADRIGCHASGHVVHLDTDAPLIDAEPADAPDRVDDPDLLAYVIYTSGSTGRPKGVQITHGGLANHLRWATNELAMRGRRGGAVFSSVAFDLVVPNLWAPLMAGQPVHLLPSDLDLADLGRLLTDAAPLSFLKLTPGHLQILTDQLSEQWLADLAEVVVVAGEPLPPALAERWRRALGPGHLINEYGPTESSVGTCVFPVDEPVTGDTVPIGQALPGIEVHVLDEALKPLPPGVVGELYVGGAGLARGYLDRPALTADRFVPSPFGPPGARLYRTGDLVRLLPEGDVDFVGRADDQVKVRGYRVELGEITAVLADHPDVKDAVVVTAKGPAESVRLLAYCVAAPDVADLPEALTAHCAARLPDYMVPDGVVVLERMPLNANGKVDKAALPPFEEARTTGFVPPRGPVEERVAEIFTDLLGVGVGGDSHFFRSGGNSILAIRLVAALRSVFEVDLPIRSVFEGPTVAELAAVVEAAILAEVEQMSEEELIARTSPEV